MAEGAEEKHDTEEQQEENGRKNPWGRANVNWAEDVENAELSGELKVIQPLSDIHIQDQKLKKMGLEDEEDEDYPTLSQAKSKKGSKKKGGKNQKVSLQAFQAQGLNDNFNAQAMRMNLPSHSRQKAPGEEDERRRPFGHSDGYDGRRGGREGGGFDREDGGGFRERRPRREDNFEPSKADTVDSWGSTNKFTPASRGFGDYKEPSRGFGDYKEPSRGPPRRGGAGFGDSYKAYDFPNTHSDSRDNWQSERPPRNDYGGEYQPPRRGGGGRGSAGFDGGYAPFSDGRGPPRRSAGFVADSKADFEDKWTMGSKYSKAEEQGPFSSIKSDPRRKFDSRVGYSDTDRWSRGADGYQQNYSPPPPQQSTGAYVPPSQRKDPFGGARPREQVLSEQQDVEEQQHVDAQVENGSAPHLHTELS